MKLSTLLEETGIDPKAKWFIAEGADAPHLTRSVPVAKALDDAMIALYQNGERLTPSNGYPVRLLLPGYEGNMNVKYLRRIKLVAEPAMGFWEAKTYAQLLHDSLNCTSVPATIFFSCALRSISGNFRRSCPSR